jgi:TolA-binding protein
MEMYARLFSIRVNRSGTKDEVDQNIAELLKMAHRDKYIDYRDIIYYTLAQMESERGNFDAAQKYLAKSAEFNTTNRTLKNKTWLQLAELSFHQKKYVIASNCYDSIDLNDPVLHDIESITSKKILLTIIKTQVEIIERQDSLQKIAAMPEDERKEFVRKLTRKLRKEQGLKEEPGVIIPIADKNQSAQTDLFTTAPAKGEWYFYNATLRTKGYSEFKSKWGNRANADNWRRSAGISIAQTGKPITGTDSLSQTGAVQQTGEISFDALYDQLPLTEALLKISNDSISNSLFILGKLLSEELEDCSSAIQTFEELRARFPQYEKMNEVLFKLYYCYGKSGQPDKAAGIKKSMEEKFPGSPLTSIVVTGKDPGNKKNNPEATKAYEQVYDLFIEGDFKKAIAEKEKADAQFGENYWTPQLMYIETVYYIKQNQDEKAYETLGKIIRNFPGTPIAEKAITLSQVLSRRKQIEEELTNLQIERPKEVAPPKTADTIATKTIVKANPDTVTVQPKQQVAPPVVPNPVIPTVDSTKNIQPASAFVFKPADKYSAMVLLNKVDMVWANETKNAFNIYNRNKYYNKQFNLSVADINGEYRVLLIGTFDNAQAALEYMQDAKKLSATQIIPWLKSDKYSFSIISAENFELLKSMKDVNSYQQFIEKSLPGKF